MEIVNLIQGLNLGGTEHSNLLRLQCLVQAGHSVRVISLFPVGQGGNLYKHKGISVEGYPYVGKFGLRSHHLVRRAVRSGHTDLVMVTGTSISSCLAAGAVQAPRILCVHYVHYYHGFSRSSRLRWRGFYAFFARKFEKITFCTEFIRQEAVSLYPPLAHRSEVLRNIFSIPSPASGGDKQAARRRMGIPTDAPVVGNAGWLHPGKRFDVLLHTASRIAAQIPELRILIAGGGPQEAELRALAQELGLEERVHWLGWQEDLTDFYRALDLCIFNSDADALGRTPVEAMAYGVPVVASVIYGGLAEAVYHGENGILLDAHDISRLSAHAVQLLRDEGLRKEFGALARQYVEEHYSSGVICPRLDRLIQEVVSV